MSTDYNGFIAGNGESSEESLREMILAKNTDAIRNFAKNEKELFTSALGQQGKSITPIKLASILNYVEALQIMHKTDPDNFKFLVTNNGDYTNNIIRDSIEQVRIGSAEFFADTVPDDMQKTMLTQRNLLFLPGTISFSSLEMTKMLSEKFPETFVDASVIRYRSRKKSDVTNISSIGYAARGQNQEALKMIRDKTIEVSEIFNHSDLSIAITEFTNGIDGLITQSGRRELSEVDEYDFVENPGEVDAKLENGMKVVDALALRLRDIREECKSQGNIVTFPMIEEEMIDRAI
ncbi:MAG: hypothetical protein GY804_06500 [Alphaproteobacteria bacterium]|nr:hypothetical protein [Alphaproteobacteria bacterium]